MVCIDENVNMFYTKINVTNITEINKIYKCTTRKTWKEEPHLCGDIARKSPRHTRHRWSRAKLD